MRELQLNRFLGKRCSLLLATACLIQHTGAQYCKVPRNVTTPDSPAADDGLAVQLELELALAFPFPSRARLPSCSLPLSSIEALL